MGLVTEGMRSLRLVMKGAGVGFMRIRLIMSLALMEVVQE